MTTLRGDRAWVNDFRETGYMVMFFPNRDVSEAEAVAGGTDQAIAHRIYAELAYLGSVAGMLVVEQEGERLNSRRYRKQLAEVQPPADLVVSKRKTGGN